MIFKRRKKRSFIRKLRDVFVPRKGWRRGFEYIGQRLKRLPDSPHNIALGFACGVITSFTPFFGIHFVLAALMAWLLRANVIASAFGTAVGNPITFPIIATMSMNIGDWVLHSRDLSARQPFTMNTLLDAMATIFDDPSYFLQEILLPYIAGGAIPGIICSMAAYFLLLGGIRSYQARKRARLKKAAAKRLAIYNKTHNIGLHKNTQATKENEEYVEKPNSSPKYCL